MSTERVDVRGAIGRAAAVIALHVSYEASQDLRQAGAAVAELVEAAKSHDLFLEAYFKACETSQPQDWMDAALLAKQWQCRTIEALARIGAP